MNKKHQAIALAVQAEEKGDYLKAITIYEKTIADLNKKIEDYNHFNTSYREDMKVIENHPRGSSEIRQRKEKLEKQKVDRDNAMFWDLNLKALCLSQVAGCHQKTAQQIPGGLSRAILFADQANETMQLMQRKYLIYSVKLEEKNIIYRDSAECAALRAQLKMSFDVEAAAASFRQACDYMHQLQSPSDEDIRAHSTYIYLAGCCDAWSVKDDIRNSVVSTYTKAIEIRNKIHDMVEVDYGFIQSVYAQFAALNPAPYSPFYGDCFKQAVTLFSTELTESSFMSFLRIMIKEFRSNDYSKEVSPELKIAHEAVKMLIHCLGVLNERCFQPNFPNSPFKNWLSASTENQLEVKMAFNNCWKNIYPSVNQTAFSNTMLSSFAKLYADMVKELGQLRKENAELRGTVTKLGLYAQPVLEEGEIMDTTALRKQA